MKKHELYAFGDSHWSVFFSQVNHGSPGVTEEHTVGVDVISIHDTTANELAGSTMWSLTKDQSRHMQRQRILSTLDSVGPVENVGLVFGEVDVRSSTTRYLRDNGSVDTGAIIELLSHYKKFVDNDLIYSGRVTRNVFIYYGWRYGVTNEMSMQHKARAEQVHCHIESLLPLIMGQYGESNIHCILPKSNVTADMLRDGIHFKDGICLKKFIMPTLERVLARLPPPSPFQCSF